MNSLVDSLNAWGAQFVDAAAAILWQSGLLIAIIFALDWLLRRKIRPAIRYAFWVMVIVKLVLPPSLALPTGAAWWLRMHKAPPPTIQTRTVMVTYGTSAFNFTPSPAIPPAQFEPPKLSFSAWAMSFSIFVSALLAAWAGFRWWQISRCISKTMAPSETIPELFEHMRREAGVRRRLMIRMTTEAMSPALCGLWRPVVLLPQSLAEKLSPEQLRAILLHELIHLRRADGWVNCAQTLLQIIYWWHPFVWLANARIRRVREEAVDDAVMFALKGKAEIYAPTLLEVAKLACTRPLAGLGIIGILESRTALRRRIERLLNFKTPGRAGLSALWILGLTAFTAVAVPMGEAPDKVEPMEASGGARFVAAIGTNDPNVIPRGPSEDAASAQSSASRPVHTNAVYSSPARQKIFEKLRNITFERISFPDPTLNGIVGVLNEETSRHAPDHQGIEFFLARNNTNVLPAQSIDISTVKINLGREVTHIRLLALLGVITTNADHPIKFAIGDNGIAFSFHGTNTVEPLHVRTLLINKTHLYAILHQYEPDESKAIFPFILDFFQDAGIDLSAPKSVYYKDGAGTLTVRATSDDLSQIEQLLARDNYTAVLLSDAKILFRRAKLDEAERELQKILSAHPDNQAALYYLSLVKQARARRGADDANARISGPQKLPNQNLPARGVSSIAVGDTNAPELRVRTFKVDMNTFGLNLGNLKSPADFQPALSNLFQNAGVEMKPPKSFFFNSRVGTLAIRASASDLDMLEAIIATLNTPPPEVTIKARFVEVDGANGGLDATFKKLLPNHGDGDANKVWTGILSSAQFKPILQALQERRDGANLVNEGEVTTLSGRQANFQIVDVKTLVNGLSSTVTNNQTKYSYQTVSSPYGTTLDVIPTVSSDGDSVTMTVIPSVTEFLGYEDPRKFSKYDKNLKHAQLPLPKSRIRKTATAATIRDGQTLVIGNLSDEQVVLEPNGTELRQPFAGKKKKQLIIFITATIFAYYSVHSYPHDFVNDSVHPRDYYDGPSF